MEVNNTNTEEILIKAFNLDGNEVFEARYNLLGFFNTLNKINQRLINNDNKYGKMCTTKKTGTF